ncbi:MAG: asparaginase [Gemmatimonadaceae bacterium]|nr:asparaginase [Gemmatimonadaceae bacterium]
MTQTHDLDVVVTRGGVVESKHRVHAAVVDLDGKLIASARDHSAHTFWRSSAKPFQVMPFVETRGFDSLDWGDDQLAIACGSHGGEPEHVAIVARMLRDLDLEDGDLACGSHEPLSSRGARIVRESGHRLTRLHHNCSGKHAAMLGFAHSKCWKRYGYERPEHPVQIAILHEIAKWTKVRPSQLEMSVDGCGVPVFALSIECMAAAYARLGAASHRGEEVPARVVGAMSQHPFLVGGTDRLDTLLIDETHGKVLSKTGAEGVYSATVPEMGIGIALKVEDGAQRAAAPALLRVLQLIGALPDTLPPRLHEVAHKSVRNSRNQCVGEVTTAA